MADEIIKETRPCKTCGGTERYKDGKCKACVQERVKLYAAKNRDQVLESTRRWRQANLEAVREYDRIRSVQYRQANPERRKAINASYAARNADKVSAAGKRWKQNNPELVRLYRMERRARQSGLSGKLPRGTIKSLFQMQRGKCACCRISIDEKYHVDHIQALAAGGQQSLLGFGGFGFGRFGLGFQLQQCLAHRDAGRGKQLAEFALSRQLTAARQQAVLNLLL